MDEKEYCEVLDVENVTSKAMQKSKTLKVVIVILLIIITGVIIWVLFYVNQKPVCPIDYEYDEDEKICFKILEAFEIYEHEDYCSIGTLIDGMCYQANSKFSIPASSFTIAGQTNYFCPSGYSLDGFTCYPNAELPARREMRRCPSGYTSNISGRSKSGIDVPYLRVPGSKCYKRVTIKP